MKLLIVESPAKAKTISKYLDNTYTVTSSVGHIRDIPKSNKDAIDIEAGFVPNYQITPGKEDVVRELKELSQKADEVILATDPDREGEAIAWHIAEVCDPGNPKSQATNSKSKTQNSKQTQDSKLKRIVFHEITEKAIQEALKNPREIDENLKTAQTARRVMDRLFGYDLSALIWKKLRYGLSAGRVQSPALRIVMEREREIRAFIPEDYWTITAQTNTPNKEALELICSEEPRDEKRTNEIVKEAQEGSWRVARVEERKTKRSPRPPFITSTLQQAASTELGFAPSRTMRIAQRLYEAGHITYMRTDSTILAPSAQKEIEHVVTNEFGAQYAAPRQYKARSKGAQEAHEAVRPTHVSKKTAGTTAEQKKLYELIRRRTVASQMADAEIMRTKVSAEITSKKDIPPFSATGSRTLFDGWLKADPGARGEDTELPSMEEGITLTVREVKADKQQTKPPKRYTEAGLVKELEKRGIGRPSTYATIMRTLSDRGYVSKDGKTLIPTDTGDVVSTFLEENFAEYISDTFTEEMEKELDEIAEGKREYVKTLREFYEPFVKAIEAKKDIPKITNLGEAPKELICPECGSGMVRKLGKSGTFFSCNRYPECEGARTIEGEAMEGPKETGEQCPECGNPLIERRGKYGAFIGCSNYPKCKYIQQSDDAKDEVTTGVVCPECGKGELAERRGKFGPFYGCTNYPTCTFTLKAKPTGNTCPECGALMMEGTKTIPERCSNKQCPHHNPHKQ